MGYLWVGTEDGLHRFNGYEFKSYISNPNDSTTISDDHIRGLVTINDTLWVATNSKGIQGYQRSENKFFSLFSNSNTPDLNNAYKVFELNNELLLFSVKNNFILFDRKLKTHEIIRLPNESIENKVEDIHVVNQNNVWLATKESGVLVLSLRDNTISPLPIFNSKSVSCFIDSKDVIYIGSEQGVEVYNKTLGTLNKTTIETGVDGFYKINDFEYYVNSENGILKYNSITDRFKSVVFQNLKENKQYTSVSFTQVLGDNKGNIWFGTQGEGLLHHNRFQNKFESFRVELPELYENQRISVFPIQKENDSTLWLGTYAGTVKYNLKTQESLLYDTGKGDITYDFFKDEYGTLWVGSITAGLMKYDAVNDTFKQWLHEDSETSLKDNEVLKIIPISKDKLWICTWSGGINEFDIITETFKPVLLDGLQIDRARSAIIDSKNHIWLGTDNGLYEIESNNILNHYTDNKNDSLRITNNRVFAISEDEQGHIWVGTSSGLTHINTETQKSDLYFKQKEFLNDFVYGLIIDSNNRVWMSTNFGLSVFNPEDKTFKNYTKEDGLQDNEFNGKSFFKDNNDLLYFGGINGFNIINPNQVVDNPYVPDVYLESVELFNQPIERNEMFKDTLQFKSAENVLTFNFSAINYLNPNKCSYQYKLENFDEDWSPVTKKKNVTYTNLNPGRYTLKIKVSNDVGQWNSKFKTVQLIIIPPWYLDTWFKGLVIGLFLLSGIVYYKVKTSLLKRDKVKLAALVDSRTQDLIQKNIELNTSHSVMLEQKNNIEFLMKELNHRVKNNLQIISSLLNMQAKNVEEQEVKDVLNIAKNRILTISYIQNDLVSNDDAVNVGVFLKNFSKKIINLLSDQETQKFKLIFQLEPDCICDINTTLLGLILNELITNTYKYAFKTVSPNHILKISCTHSKEGLKITVADNGVGYSVYAIRTNTLGLDLVNTMVQQLDGTIKVSTNNGVENVIQLPC
ncbi:diguanylate cyclase [Formosa agariphila KMM 3901]|uniref:Diguanylate cyclase n=2 Tax=Formosa TaxID=225842 RepID=T2KHM1_FORAG|nr:diguanylate cyclase [Formosa agariphila KMM 3901]